VYASQLDGSVWYQNNSWYEYRAIGGKE